MKPYKMKVEIWSDVICPFCYIGKRKFETALSQFKHSDSIEIVWKSYQLAPDFKTDPNKSVYQVLAEHKGMSLEQAKGISDQVVSMAKQVGLVYHFEKTIPANSFNANRLSQLAKHRGFQEAVEEVLFKAYFTDGRNIDDIPTLIDLGKEIGLDSTEVKTVLETNLYMDEVEQDLSEASQIGIRGVPYFLFDSKLAVSGAQESATFLQILEKSFAEWEKENPKQTLVAIEGQTCKVGEGC